MAKRTASNTVATKRKPARAAASRKTGKAVDKPTRSKKVTVDRRRGDRRADGTQAAPASPKLERRQKVNRRRQIDPTTCERDYTDDEIEFMNALDVYKRKSGRMFPTCSEVLEVIRSLGYSKQGPATPAAGANEARHRDDCFGAVTRDDLEKPVDRPLEPVS